MYANFTHSTKAVFFGFVVAVLLGTALPVGAEKKPEKKATPPVTVNVATAKQQAWMDQISATGTFSAFQGIIVKPQVAGPITKIYFQDGTYIEAGQPIVQIYPNVVEAQLERNLAAMQLAKLNYERGAILFQKRVISQQQLDTLTSTLEQAESTVLENQANLALYNIVAPFSGMIGLRRVDLGTYVSPGQDIVPLQQVDPIRIEFTVPEVYLSKLSLGQKVAVKVSSGGKAMDYGEVYAFDSGVNPNTRALAVRAKVPNKSRHLIPGTFGEVTLFAGNQHEVITVPQTAIVYSPESSYIYKVVDNKAAKTAVTIGLRKGNEIEVKTGIKAGDVVVTAGQVKLIDGSAVSPVTENPNKGEKSSAIASQTLGEPIKSKPLVTTLPPESTPSVNAPAPAATTSQATTSQSQGTH